jgi:SAM-dependent methyltransferase
MLSPPPSRAAKAESLPAAAALAAAFSACVLVYEVALSRLFSVLVRDDLVFIAVSLAVCGLGVGGLVTYLVADRGVPERAGYLPACAAGLGATVVLALILLLNVHLPLERSTLLCLAALPPFVCAGMGLSALFRRFAARANPLYAADLAGASLGALGSVLLLSHLGGAIQTLLAVAVLAFAAAAVEATRRRLALAASGAALLGAIATGLVVLNARGDLLRVDFSRVGRDTHLGREIRQTGGRIIETRWDAYSRVDVVESPSHPYRRELYINSGSQANLWRFSGDVEAVAPLREKLEAIPYSVGASRRVLNLGAGGGYDALVALLCGAEHVTCVEVNPAVVQTVLDHGDYGGDLFRWRNVDVRIDEARSFVARDRTRYDVIFSAMTSTLAFSDVRESTFLESTVYTVEALESYLDRLEPGGRLGIVINLPYLLDRLVLTLLAAWERRGVPPVEAMRRILAVHDPRPEAGAYAYLVLGSLEPLLPEVLSRTLETARSRGLTVHFAPGVPAGAEASTGLARIAAGELTPEAMANGYPGYRVDPTTDDRPHFFQWERRPNRHLLSLLVKVGGILVAYVLFFLAARGGRPKATLDPLPVAAAAYFATIGIGFMLVEVTLLSLFNRFLGYPTLTLSIVLFTLLLSGGLGSLTGGALVRRDPARAAGRAALVVAAIAAILALVLPAVFDRLQSLSAEGRALAAVLLLAPLGFCLGWAFPLGIRAVERRAPRLVPWIWGWNGILSVVGSTLAVLAAMEIGLRFTLLAGAALYALLPLASRRLAPDGKVQIESPA